MLDTRADFRFRLVGLPHRLGHSAAFRLLAMDVADEAILGQERLVGCRSVGGIGPHPARRIVLVEQGHFDFQNNGEMLLYHGHLRSRRTYQLVTPLCIAAERMGRTGSAVLTAIL